MRRHVSGPARAGHDRPEFQSEGRTMRRTVSWMVVGVVMLAGTAGAQTPSVVARPRSRRRCWNKRMRLKESRYQIGQIERLLEGAVEHGATVIRDRLLAIMPADMLLTENARARGFRLDGYGVFFDVEVPNLEGSVPWSFRTLNQNDLGVNDALQTIRAYIQATGGNDVTVRQALESLELQVTPMTAAAVTDRGSGHCFAHRQCHCRRPPGRPRPCRTTRFWRIRTKPIELPFERRSLMPCSTTRAG